MGIAEIVCEIIKHLLFSWSRSVWPSMKVKISIINTWCITMYEAVTVPSLTMMTSTVSKESLARDTHTHTDKRTDKHTHTHTQTYSGHLHWTLQSHLKHVKIYIYIFVPKGLKCHTKAWPRLPSLPAPLVPSTWWTWRSSIASLFLCLWDYKSVCVDRVLDGMILLGWIWNMSRYLYPKA